MPPSVSQADFDKIWCAEKTDRSASLKWKQGRVCPLCWTPSVPPRSGLNWTAFSPIPHSPGRIAAFDEGLEGFLGRGGRLKGSGPPAVQ